MSTLSAEDAMILMLARIEKLAADRDRMARDKQRLTGEVTDLRGRLMTCQHGNNRRDRDMKAAEAKIYEWAEYASTLRGAINAIDPRAVRSKKIVLPDQPKPLELEMPF